MTSMDQGRVGRQPDDPGSISPRGARNFVQHLEDAVRENPVPAALIGMGFLWMFMGGSRISLFGPEREQTLSHTAAGMSEAAHGTAQRRGSSLTRTAGRAAEALSDLGARAGEMTRTAASAVGDLAASTGAQITDAASSAYQGTGSAAAQAVQTVSKSATTASQAAQRAGAEWGRTAQQSMAELFERQPLVLGAVGLAIGAGLAASLPLSETENRLMGDASDSLKERAQDLLSDKAEQVKSLAQRTLQETQAQGLTPRAAGDALRGLTDKVVGVAEATGKSLKEQIQGERSEGANTDARRG